MAPRPCVVQGIDARCGTFVVPENRAKPDGRTIGLHVVVVPAPFEATPRVAVTYLTGGPGDAAAEQWFAQGWQTSALNTIRDLLPVSNLSDLTGHFPDSRTVVFVHLGHNWWGVGGCLDQIVTDFVDRGTTTGLDTTRCRGAVVVPPFEVGD